MKIKFDKKTSELVSENINIRKTVRKCDKCGLYYIPFLGHKCEVKSGRMKHICDCCGREMTEGDYYITGRYFTMDSNGAMIENEYCLCSEEGNHDRITDCMTGYIANTFYENTWEFEGVLKNECI